MKHRTTRRRVISRGLLAVLLAGLCMSFGAASRAAADGPGYKRGQVIVELDASSGATIDDVNRSHGTRTLKQLAPNTYLLQIPAGTSVPQIDTEMSADTRLQTAEPNYIGTAPEANPSRIGAWGGYDSQPYYSQNALDLLNLSQAEGISRGAGVTVAVVDTGIQLGHPALSASLSDDGYDFLDNDAVPSDEFLQLDTNGNGVFDEAAGHGTHIAGIIHLIAPEARIMPLRALDSDGVGDLSAVVQSIRYAVDHGARVINLSLGTPTWSDILHDAILYASSHGVVVVAAAGNLSSSTAQYPAGDRCALGITSSDAARVKSDFANYGGWVDFTSPGEQIYSAFPQDGYATWSGTSMAAPFVAGQAALILSVMPWLNPRQVALVIDDTAVPIDDLNPLYRGKLGAGEIDIGASLTRLLARKIDWSDAHGHISSSCLSWSGW